LSKVLAATLASASLLIAGSVSAEPDPTPPPAASADAAASAAQAPAPTPAPAPAPQAAKKKLPSDIICKPDVGTGTRVGGAKICLTREEWRQRENY
jgi:hypothetical protein